MRKYYSIVMLLVCIFVLSACDDKSGGIKQINCISNSDCPSGQTCINGVCEEDVYNPNDKPPLNLDGDTITSENQEDGCFMQGGCPDGYKCEGTMCVPDTTTPDGDTTTPVTDGDTQVETDFDLDKPETETDTTTPPVDGDTDNVAEEEEDKSTGKTCEYDSDCNNGLYCDGKETCGSNGICQYGENPCNDNVDCTDDTCDEQKNTCDHTTNHTLCTDSDPCNGNEYCDQVQGCQPGIAPDCEDGIPCTEDTCVEFSGCVNEAKNTLCDDKIDCTSDVCDITEKGCVYTVDNTKCADDGKACTKEYCDKDLGCLLTLDNSQCKDDFSCTNDVCTAANGCEFKPDHSQCTGDNVCNPASSKHDATTGCAPKEECQTNAQCDDGLWCNGEETCDGAYCAQGTPPDCDDKVTCTSDSCDESTNKCVHTPLDEECSDNDVCTGIETCHITGGCQPGTKLSCNDNIKCTADTCDPVKGCVNEPNDERCDDGINCTIDSCNAKKDCQNVEDNTFCDDLVPCTVDVCEIASNGCVSTPNHDYCKDDYPCTTDTCSPKFNCQHAADNSKCDDSVGCTNDICVTSSGCAYNADDTNCSSGLICDPDKDCVEPPKCVTNADCADGNLCNGTETCVGGVCKDGPPLNCNDSIACTVDTCSPADGCFNTQDHSLCDDHNDCTGDYCDTEKNCLYKVIKDTDNDYFYDDQCQGGTDCDDSDPDINPGKAEVCDDTKDNDCDGKTDLQDSDCNCAGGCDAGKICCDNKCVDPNTNKDHCGGCFSKCSSSQACYNGSCISGKCANALNNLITRNTRYNSRTTCGAGNDYRANGCSATSDQTTGQDNIYAIKAIAGNDMRVSLYPPGDSIQYEAMYFLSDCNNPNSCFDYQGSGNYIDMEIPASNTGQIFFAVVDYKSGNCGNYDFKVDYDYEPSDCNNTGLVAIYGNNALLTTFVLWFLFGALIWKRKSILKLIVEK